MGFFLRFQINGFDYAFFIWWLACSAQDSTGIIAVTISPRYYQELYNPKDPLKIPIDR